MPGVRSVKDKQMAAYLKDRKVQRTICRCPICHSLQPLKGLYNHIAAHK